MRKSLVFVLLLFSSKIFGQQNCFENKQYPLPVVSEQTKKLYESKLAEAIADHEKDTTNADAIVWLGRRTAYLGKYEEAIAIFTKGIALHPSDARLYRHRGHRYITLRCFDKAIADLTKAAELSEYIKDEIEPDGLPNAANIPTSTLRTNIYYHIGLVYYLTNAYEKSARAFGKCMILSTNNDMYVAAANWFYISMRKLKRDEEAEGILEAIDTGWKLLENMDYLRILQLYKEHAAFKDPVQYLKENAKDLSLAGFGYGLGNYLALKGEPEKAKEVFNFILNSDQWAAFGFIAAEAELARLK